MATLTFDQTPILSYLGLGQDYTPSPQRDPIEFLIKHLSQLPPHLLAHFSRITNPKQRTTIPAIRNRRLKYVSSHPPDLSYLEARETWPNLWEGRERRGVEEGQDEKRWAETGFLEGSTKHVGKLGSLLGGYAEERGAERARIMRRERVAEVEVFVPEEDEDSDEEIIPEVLQDTRTDAEIKESFERLVNERFIYGLLEASLLQLYDLKIF